MMDFNYNAEAFKEQDEFLKMLAKRIGLHDKDYIREFAVYYTHQASNNEKSIDFLNRELGRYIKEGKLDNWVKDNANNKAIKDYANINFFWSSYCRTCGGIGLDSPSDFSNEELAKLNAIYGGVCSSNSLCDFHESDCDYDNGNSIFAYTSSRRYM